MTLFHCSPKPRKYEKVPQHSASVDRSDVLVVGTGYLGSRVAGLATREEVTVHTTTRTREKFPAFRSQGWSPVRFDWTQEPGPENEIPALSASPRVLVAVSYDRNSGVGREESQVGGLKRLLGLLPADARICYISTTGVYHQVDGAWVDESSPAEPSREGGRAHLRAEELIQQNRFDGRWHVLRLSGIYGPGRVPRIADVRDGRPIASLETGYLNLIHVDDAAAAVLASWHLLGQRMIAPEASRSDHHAHEDDNAGLFLISDDEPVVRREFYQEIARQCGAPPPQFKAPAVDSPKLMRSESNKRIRNQKMKRVLLPTLRYPNYRSGLADVLDAALE